MSKPILCVDFDGVIHSYTSGWLGAAVILDPPVPGAFKWLYSALYHFNVNIYSSRSKELEGIKAMREWLERHVRACTDLTTPQADMLLRDIVFTHEKPAAFLTVDDRAICFDGDWKALDSKTLLKFKPWYQRTFDAPVI